MFKKINIQAKMRKLIANEEKGFSVYYGYRTMYISIEQEFKGHTVVKDIVKFIEAERSKKHIWCHSIVLESWMMADECGNCKRLATSICNRFGSECTTKNANCFQKLASKCVNIFISKKIPPYAYISRCVIPLNSKATK